MRDLAWLRFKMQTGNDNQTATETETDTATSTATETRCRCMYLCPVTVPLPLSSSVDIFYTLPHSCAARINQAALLRLSIPPSAGALIASLVLELQLELGLPALGKC